MIFFFRIENHLNRVYDAKLLGINLGEGHFIFHVSSF